MLNHSCTRCRSKKLRCDGSSPCSNCRAKGIGHVCQRAQRKERPRKAALAAKRNDVPHNGTTTTTTTTITTPPQSLSFIEEFTDGASLAKLRVRTDTDGSANTLASGADSDSGRSPGSSVSSSTAGAQRPPVQFSPAPPHFRGCLVTLKHIADARDYIGALHPALRLINYVFQWRCQSMAHSCVHLPTIKHTLRQLFSDEWAGEIAQDQLALALMAVAMSIQFSPRRGPYAHVFQVVQAMGQKYEPGRRQQHIHQLARSIVQSRLLDTNTSLEGVQTIVLLLIYDLDEESFKERLWMSAVRCAQSLKLNHIQQDTSGAVPSLESELGVRVWWFLVCRDWLYALGRGTYKLHPNHFTTRLPMIITDEDLAEGKTPNRQAGEVSPVSVSIPFIGLASLIRQLVDMKPERTQEDFSQDVADAFDTFVETLPYIFSLSTTHVAALDDNLFTQQRLESERWLLHQQIFHAYLHFDELRLDRPICPQMVALANHTLQLQDRVRARCHIIDSMRINVTGVLRAITVLTIDLLQKHRDSKVSLARQVTLGKIKEAIHKCEASPNLAEGDLDNVYKLIEMEESAWAAKTRATAPRNSIKTIFASPVPMNASPPEHRGGYIGGGGAAPTQVPLDYVGSNSDHHHNLPQTTSQDSTTTGSFSGTASEDSVGTTSPVVDMPIVPMQHAQHHPQHPIKSEQPGHRCSISSVLLNSAGEQVQNEQAQTHHHPSNGFDSHERRDSGPQQMQQHPSGSVGPYARHDSAHGTQQPHDSMLHHHHPHPHHPQQHQWTPVMPNGPSHHIPLAHPNSHHINGASALMGGAAGPPHSVQSQNRAMNGGPFTGNYTHAHGHAHGHPQGGDGGFSSFGAPPPQAAAPLHQAHHGHGHQAPPPLPTGPPPHNQHLDVAQWAALVPSDQAVSPLFAPHLLAAHQPSLEDLYATFIT